MDTLNTISTPNKNNEQQLSDQPIRHIKIFRNESGYGFTLSRFAIYPNNLRQIEQTKPIIKINVRCL